MSFLFYMFRDILKDPKSSKLTKLIWKITTRQCKNETYD